MKHSLCTKFYNKIVLFIISLKKTLKFVQYNVLCAQFDMNLTNQKSSDLLLLDIMSDLSFMYLINFYPFSSKLIYFPHHLIYIFIIQHFGYKKPVNLVSNEYLLKFNCVCHPIDYCH